MTSDKQALQRFELNNGQFFSVYRYKNLKWELNGEQIGFGDLRKTDIQHIQNVLEPGEEFVGWNEHHKSDWQLTDLPMLRITKKRIMYRADIEAEDAKKHRKPKKR